LRASNVRLLVRTPGRRALVMAGRDWRSDRHRLHALPVSLRAVGSVERRLYARRSAVASERNNESSREHEQAPVTTE